MFTRPRCRVFEPLATSQIRLRNLIKITGININCDCEDKKFLLYFTLHLSAFSKPFYTSEKLEYRSKIDWPEINCQMIETSSQKFICVRVWKKSDSKIQNEGVCDSADEMLFLWGVYFTGLVSIVSGESLQFRKNTLLFHLFGGIFTSHEQIIDQTLESQIDCDPSDDDKYSTSPSFSLTNGAMNRYSPEVAEVAPRSLDSNKYTKSDRSIQPVTLVRLNKPRDQKVRFIKLEFPKNEVQLSYTINQLLKIQEVQRRVHLKQESSKMLAERICTKSAACLNLDLIIRKPVFYEPQKQPGMGKTLSRLLATQEAPPKPEVVLKIHEFRMKIECAKFRIKLLTQERDRSRHFNKSLESKREKLKDDNTEREAMIWDKLRMLTREYPKNHEEKLAPQREVLGNALQTVMLQLSETKLSLLRELNEIYQVSRNSAGQYLINGIHLPDAESYSDATHSTPNEISIALGYVAHAVVIISRILNIPLRNYIKQEGSRSKIMDNVKVLAPTDRTFPLFCRAMPPPNVLLYGVYLLNQNISQLKNLLGLRKGDLRATLANLLDLMMSPTCEDLCLQFTKNASMKQVENSMSSVESVPLNIPINIDSSVSSSSPRVSRSLDDFDDLIESLKSKFNSSAPSLTSPE